MLAVAPLFLFPFFGSGTIASVLLWLSLFAAVWLVLSPSLLGGEMLDDARRRVLGGIVRDPLFWVFVCIAVVAGIRTLNSGISVFFDYETSEWSILEPSVPFLPGSVEGSGFLPFAGALSAGVVVTACRHALGKAARDMMLLLMAAFSGIAALAALVMLGSGDAVVATAVSAASERFSGVGLGFALCALCSVAALFVALERGWVKSQPFLLTAVSGNVAAAFVFLPPQDTIAFSLAFFVFLLFSAVCVWNLLSRVRGVHFVVFSILYVVFACVAVEVSVPDEILEDKMETFAELDSDAENDVRGVLSEVAAKAWKENVWAGTGVGAFRFQPRFILSEEEFEKLPRQVLVVPNAWRHVLAERGIIGVMLLALPLAFLLASYFAGAVRCIRFRFLPEPPAVLPLLAVPATVFASFFDTSLLRAEVLAVSGAILAISSKSFPKGDS